MTARPAIAPHAAFRKTAGRALRLALAAAFLFLSASPALCQDSLPAAAEGQMAFAAHLMKTGDYYRAVTEYQRFLFFFPQSPLIPEAKLGIARAYILGEQYRDAADSARDFISVFPENRLCFQARLILAQAQGRLGDAAGAAEEFLRAAGSAPDVADADRAWAGLGLVYLEAGDFSGARESFSRIREGLAAGCPPDEVQKRLALADTLPHKSPALAGTLSIVPGLGQAYVGRFQDAAFTFLLDGALIWAAAESFHDDQPALGAVVGVVAVGFYAGNIYGAVSSARKFNRRESDRLIQSVKQACTPRIFGGISPEPGGLSATLGFSF
ncbi:MAG: tetratricopeptide repeat protein [Thermodesulfobacteriota bacterium]